MLTPEKYTFCEQQQTQFSGCNATQTLGSNCRASFYPNFPNSLRICSPSLWLSNAPKMRWKFQLLTLKSQTDVRLYFCTHQSRLLEKIYPSNRTTSRLLHCPNGRRLMLNTFNPRWRSSAAGGPIQSLREQVGLRPKLRCAPQKVLKSWSFLTENILKREKPTRVKTLL